jgi:hypothetical protein
MVDTDSVTSPLIDDSNKELTIPRTTKPKHAGGRPKIKIDYETVRLLATVHATQEEIASSLNLSVRTLSRDNEFRLVYKKALDAGKLSLRRAQFAKALGVPAILARDDDGKILLDEKGRPLVLVPGSAPSDTQQIWLGKQLLGQRDKVELGADKDSPFAIAVVIQESSKGRPFKEVRKGKSAT